MHRGGVWYGDQRVDLGYRDYGVVDLLELEQQGVDVEPMRRLLRENRAISSIAADLDQKSCWEVLTDPDIAERHFTANEEGVAVLARASQKQVVNVAQHGGLCGVMVSRSRPAIGGADHAGS